MNRTQSLRMSNGVKKSNHKFTTYPIPPKTSKRKIYNNIKEKLLQAKIHNYKAKQKVLLDDIKEVIKVYKKCTKMSKQSTQPKSTYFEDIQLVVSYFVINYLHLIKYTIYSPEHEKCSLNSLRSL